MTNIMVNVLVTFYNQQDYVDKALESVLMQNTNFKIQILVGDDGSSDDTVPKIQEWCKEHPDMIKIYRMEREQGAAIGGFRASRNRLNLLKHVEGKYFIFLDGDDYFTDETKLQRQVDVLENESNSDCVACGHGINAVFPDGTSKPFAVTELQERKYDVAEYWKSLYFHTDTLLIRSSVIARLPVDLLENNFNDNLITYTILQYGKIYYFPKCMAAYLQTGDGIWTSGKESINNLRNMFLYDLAITINPGLQSQTDIRMVSTWKKMFKLRKSIQKDELLPYYNEAFDKKLKYSLLWICYNEISSKDKMILMLKLADVCLVKYSDVLQRKIFGRN